MLRSLLVQVLWAPVLTLTLGGALVAFEARDQQRMAARMRGVTSLRQSLDRALLQLYDRHTRTVRRTREALLEPRLQTAILAWSSAHYLREMDRHVADAHDVIRAIDVADGHPRLATDLAHLDRQVQRIAEHAQQMAPALDSLLAASTGGFEELEPAPVDEEEPPDDSDEIRKGDAADGPAGEEPLVSPLASPTQSTAAASTYEALRLARQQFLRADIAMQAALRIAERMAHRAATLQASHAARELSTVPLAVWIAYLVWVPFALLLTYWPLRRLTRLSAGMTDTHARTTEEKELLARLTDLDASRRSLETTLAERSLDAERAANTARRVEQELALLRLYNENLVNSLRSAIVVTDAAFAVTGYNRTAREQLGFGRGHLGTDVREHPLCGALLHSTRAAQSDLERAMTEREVLRYEGLAFSGSGQEVLLDLTVAPYLDEGDSARGLLWVADDVTDAIRIKKQLLAAERLAAVGSLSAQVAHEVRNPLSAIGLNAELLEEELSTDRGEDGSAEAIALLRAIASEVERLTQITDGYLQLARLPQPEPEPVDLNRIVADLFTILGEEMKAHAIQVELELATPAPRAWVDAGQLRQALLNIVRNSREAMDDGGTLRVRTEIRNNESRIEIVDNGPGIPADVAPRVFEPFFTTKREGTGLGLSLTQQIISEHAGSVRVSRATTGGAAITISLPTDAPQGAADGLE